MTAQHSHLQQNPARLTDVITIRKATADDAVATWNLRIEAIRSQCTGFYPKHLLDIWTDGDVTDRYRKSVDGKLYVAVDNQQIVGTGTIDLATGQLDAIFVDPNHLRRGIARQMVEHLQKLAVDAGLTELCLESTLNAAPFYRICGFKGEVTATYESPRGISLECIPMTKKLV